MPTEKSGLSGAQTSASAQPFEIKKVYERLADCKSNTEMVKELEKYGKVNIMPPPNGFIGKDLEEMKNFKMILERPDGTEIKIKVNGKKVKLEQEKDTMPEIKADTPSKIIGSGIKIKVKNKKLKQNEEPSAPIKIASTFDSKVEREKDTVSEVKNTTEMKLDFFTANFTASVQNDNRYNQGQKDDIITEAKELASNQDFIGLRNMINELGYSELLKWFNQNFSEELKKQSEQKAAIVETASTSANPETDRQFRQLLGENLETVNKENAKAKDDGPNRA